MNGKIQLGFILFISFLFLLACSPNEGDTIEKYYEDDDDSAGEDDDSGVDDDDVADDDDNDTADDDDSVPEEIPEVPTELRAIESGSNTINLSWTDNSDDEDGFWVYRQESGAKGFTAIAQTGPDVPFYFDDSVACETQYDYYVTAFNMAGESTGSNEAAATAGYCEVAAPTDLAAMTISQTQVDLAWSDNSFNETNFQIQRKESGSDVWVNIGDAEANVTEYSDLVAVCDTDYQYRVRAYNQHSDSAWCSPAGTTTMDCPIVRPQPVLGSIEPGSYVALSRDYLQPPPNPLYPLEITGEGIAINTQVEIGNFMIPCDTGGEGINCKADESGNPISSTCAQSCVVDLPNTIMRHANEYVVRLHTPDPVWNGLNTSADTVFFSVNAPVPQVDGIWPRGITQLLDEYGDPISSEPKISVWGRNFMENIQISLESNHGNIADLTTDENSGEQVLRSLVSTLDIFPSKSSYEFQISNPSPGGGERTLPFGLFPRFDPWYDFLTIQMKPYSPGSFLPLIFNSTRMPKPRKISNGVVWTGKASWASVRDQSGNLLTRIHKKRSVKMIPTPLEAYSIDIQTINSPNSLNLLESVDSVFRGGDGTFDQENIIAAPAYVEHVSIADLNSDGVPDVISSGGDSDSILYFLGKEDGTFNEPVKVTISEQSYFEIQQFLIEDLDNDGVPDFIAVQEDDGPLVLLFSTPVDFFVDRIDLNMGNFSKAAAISDINSDGLLDIATASGNNVSIRLGRGDGTFHPLTTFSTDAWTYLIDIGDVNGDWRPDLILMNSDSEISIHLGNGDGSFGEKTGLNVGDYVWSLDHGDINGDGAPDIIAASYSSNDPIAAIWFGQGDGTFSDRTNVEILNGGGVLVSDMNGDDVLDLVGILDEVHIRMGNGDGSFAEPTICYMGPGVSSLAIGDLNLDGAPDLVSPYAIENIVFKLANGEGRFGARSTFDMGIHPAAVSVADLNNDDLLDIVTTNYGSNDVSIRLGNGDGTFMENGDLAMGDHPQSLKIADLNDDEVPDIITTNLGNNGVSIRLGIGGGNFGDSTILPMGTGTYSVDIADLNDDEIPDIVTANQYSDDISIRLGTGNGTFEENMELAMGDSPSDVLIADLDGDEVPDIVTANKGSGDVSIRFGHGDGTFESNINLQMDIQLSSLAIGDLNADNALDIVTANQKSDDVSIRLGNGDGTFGQKMDIPMGDAPRSVIIEDISADNIPDIITANYNSDDVTIRLGNGDGTFNDLVYMDFGESPSSIAIANLDQNKYNDIIVTNYSSDKISIRLMGIPGTWHQELTDSFSDDRAQPWLPKYATAGANTLLQIHQGRQTVSKVGATVLLEWTTQPTGTVDLVLTAPDGQEVDLGSYNTFTPWPDDQNPTSWRLNKVFREYDLGTVPGFPDLENLHGLQPTGYWEFEINNQTGADAEVKNWTVITDGEF